MKVPSRRVFAHLEPLEARIAPAFAATFLLGENDDRLSTLQGSFGNGRVGSAVSSAGDINGDGFDDIIIGAERAGAVEQGIAYVLFGTRSGLPSDVALGELDGTRGFRIEGAAEGDRVGASVGAAGDVNGDGLDDFIIGAPGGNVGNPGGAAAIIFGRREGFPARLGFFELDGGDGFLIQGNQGGGNAVGSAVAGAGDVNGDSLDDVIIGASGADGGRGGAVVIFGRSGPRERTFAPETLDGTQGFLLLGAAAGDLAGNAVSGAGDVNGDGFDDIIVGAWEADEGSFERGAAYVIFGKADFTGMPTSSLGSISGSLGFKFSGLQNRQYVGTSVAAAGDVNGDGFADLLIGALGEASGGLEARGAAYVIFGRSSFSGDLTSNLTLEQGFSILGPGVNSRLGQSVAGAGDVNGDGLADLLIGAPGVGSGSAYLYFGKRGPFATGQPFSPQGHDGVQINGDGSGDFAGGAVASAGDVDGDGFADLLIGAPFSNFPSPLTGSAYVVRGGLSGVSVEPFFKDQRTAIFTDIDGDIVTVKVSKGTLDQSNFSLLARGPGTDRALFLALDLSAPENTLAPEFDRAQVTVSVRRAGGGDGRVEMGHLMARNVDLGAVKIAGDLGRISAGDALADAGLKSLTVGSFAAQGLRLQDLAGDRSLSFVVGPMGALKVSRDFSGSFLNIPAGDSAGISSVSIGGSVRGQLGVPATLFSLGTIGAVRILGDLQGGADGLSGSIFGIRLGPVFVGGSVLGGTGIRSGVISGEEGIGKVTIKGDLIGDGPFSGSIYTVDPGAPIASVSIGGDARVGTGSRSGGIMAGGRLGPVVIKGDVIGSEKSPFSITGAGSLAPGRSSLAIASLKVGGDLDHAQIKGGFSPISAPVNGHAQIGSISVGGDWIASTATAGLASGPTPGPGGVFGIGSETYIAAGPTGVVASIAKITIKGRALGSPELGDRFAIVAEQIGALTIGGQRIALTRGAGNDLAPIALGPHQDFVVREILRPPPAP